MDAGCGVVYMVACLVGRDGVCESVFVKYMKDRRNASSLYYNFAGLCGFGASRCLSLAFPAFCPVEGSTYICNTGGPLIAPTRFLLMRKGLDAILRGQGCTVGGTKSHQ